MAEFKGVEGNAHRIILIEKQREKERKQYEDTLKKIKEEAEKGVISMESKFAGVTDSWEESLKASTVGLVTLEDFKKKRITLELEEASNIKRKQDLRFWFV
jgi:protein FAM50